LVECEYSQRERDNAAIGFLKNGVGGGHE
jgi:hypothetical protein